MKCSGHRKLLCELSKLSKSKAFIVLGYQTNTDASIVVYKFRPERTGLNMYADYARPQLTFLALMPWPALCETVYMCTAYSVHEFIYNSHLLKMGQIIKTTYYG